MNLAYVTVFDATDIRNWSGLDRYIWESLAAQGENVELVGSLKHPRSFGRKIRKFWGSTIERKIFSHLWDVDTAKGYAHDAASRIATSAADAILSPSPIPIAYLERKEPLFLWTDAPFCGLLDFYPEFARENMCSASVKAGLEIDRAVLERCTLAIYSSDWAAQSAINYHGIPAEKVKVIPFGANIQGSPDRDQIQKIIDERSRQCLRLLFIGVDWERKGGATALAAAKAVHERGVEVELTIVGCQPPEGEAVPDFVKCLGFIGKDTPEGRAALNHLLAESHILIVPSQAECYGLVFAEAHAFGVPCAATGVGGIPTIVKDGVTGRLFTLEASPEIWADWLCQTFNAPGRYREMAMAAYARYHDLLNWDVAGREVDRLIRECI
jgi:glycosyltransferase involved in cell wall biosynthesis